MHEVAPESMATLERNEMDEGLESESEAGDAVGNEVETADVEGECVGNENDDRYVGEVENQESGVDEGDTMGGRRAEGEEGKAAELEEREGWPRWLQSAVDMLWAGERGKELKSILIKLIKIEMCLGFKGEKMVRFKSIFMETHTEYRTCTGRRQRLPEDGEETSASTRVHGLPQKT